jgi:hypothetical protein
MAGLDSSVFEAEVEAAGQIRFEFCDSAAFDEEILDPNLDTIADSNHLHAEPEVGGESAQVSRQDKVGAKGFANLLRGKSPFRQREN